MTSTEEAPASFRDKLKFLGPGVVLAALAIGSGELILTPRSGAQYGFVLLWVPILTIVYKAAFSEGLARLTIASGDDVFRAFGWLPGPKHWAQYFIILVFSLDMIGYGGIALAAGSAVIGLFPGIDIRLASLVTACLVPVLLFTGYTWYEIHHIPEANDLLACADVLIAGRYDASQRLTRGLRGSANQTIHLLTARYAMQDLRCVPPSEVVITAEGEVVVSGIDPLRWA